MFYKSERQILNFLKFAPIVFIISMGIVITLFLFYQSSQALKNDKQEITEKFIQDNQKLVQDQVEQAYNYVQSQKDLTHRRLQESLYDAVQFAHTIAQSIYKENEGKSKAYIAKEIKIALRDVRFNQGRGYFFIYDKKGVNVMHPLLPQVEGKNLRFFNNKEGQAPVDESLKLLKDKADSFQVWYWQKSKDDPKLYKKMGYVKNLYEMGWFIGTGEYVNEYETQLKNETLRYIRNIEFGNNGYIFVLDYEGNILSTINEKIEKNTFSSSGSDSIQSVFKEGIIKAKDGGGFIEYLHTSEYLKKRDALKTSYVKAFDEWGWVLGSGFYQDDLDRTILEKKHKIDANFMDYTKNTFLIILGLIIILLIISVYISRIIERKFKDYQGNIQEQIENNIDQKNHLIQAQKAAKIGNWELDIDTMTAIWSDEVFNIFGIVNRPETVGPEALQKIMLEEDWEKFHCSMNQCITDNCEHNAIYRIKRELDGEIRWIDCRGQKLLNKNKIIGTIQDITEQKRIEQVLFEKKERLDIFFNASPLAIVISDLNKQIVECNDTFSDMLGFTKEEITNMSIEELTFSDEEYDYNLELIKRLVLGEIKTFKIQKRYLKKDGSFMWGNATVVPIFSKEKKIEFFLAMIEDITMIKETEDQLLQKDQMLHHQSKMAAMGEMLENIAHQWRQPLSVITTSASAVKLHQEFDRLDEAEIIRSMDAIMDSSKHLSTTIDEFRDFFKPNKEKSHFNIKEPYDKTVSLLSSKFKNRSIDLIDDIIEIDIVGYENSLIQVLMNIYNNSKDALEECEHAKKYIFTSIKDVDDHVKITIKDTAGGIPDDIIHKVFEPYFTTKHQSQGTGIGLYMSEEIIAKHMHGTITVQNLEFDYQGEHYKGAQFTITFPKIIA